MLKLLEQTRDEIVKIIAGSSLPINLGLQVITVLNGLEKIEDEEKSKDKKAQNTPV